MAGGFLSGKYTRQNADKEGRRANYDFPPIDKEKAYDIIDVMQPMASSKGVSVAQVALAWLLHQPVVTSVILGAKNPEQLKDNLNSGNLDFTEDEIHNWMP